MMTPSNGNIFHVTSHVCGEFTGHRWIAHTKASDVEFDVFFDLRLNKRFSKQRWNWWFETPSRPFWRHSYVQGRTPSQVPTTGILQNHRGTTRHLHLTFITSWKFVHDTLFYTKLLCVGGLSFYILCYRSRQLILWMDLEVRVWMEYMGFSEEQRGLMLHENYLMSYNKFHKCSLLISRIYLLMSNIISKCPRVRHCQP